ncbi:Alpha/Beta hydrolase protein [Mycena latifolia]|nr:Alpha/Beta hydrolase protein [Mycena latifolia]
MRFLPAFVCAVSVSLCHANSVTVKTTYGLLHGSQIDGISTFKGIRYAQPVTGTRRWEPPVPFISASVQNATSLGPSCVQQFPFVGSALYQFLFNVPAPPEDEDCLFLNVWAPASKSHKLPVLVWIHGGALDFGTASVPLYDGASIAANQGIIVVSFNYRTNVFGFPGSLDLPLVRNNLGFLDQELALKWVQDNIARFGGDPDKVTIMGQSAGSESVSAAIQRHAPGTAPFRAAIMLSGADVSVSPTPNFTLFNNFAAAVGCPQDPGPVRLKQVPASDIRSFVNGPTSGLFQPLIDEVIIFSDPLQRIRSGLTAQVPFIIGNTQDDGSIVRAAMNLTDLTAFLNSSPAELWSAAAVGAGTANIYRYTYGAVFADLQLFPGAGAWHSSELPEIFGTFNPATATAPEVALSHTMQTLVANFAKNPTASPAPNWPRYVPGNRTATLAKLAYDGNVLVRNVVQAVTSDAIDGPCDALWNQLLDVRI